MKHRFLFISLLLISHSIILSAALAADDWYPFLPKNDLTASGAISMADWSAEAAGKFGRITRQGEKLVYNNKEIKLWGTCLGFSDSKPQKEDAERMAAMFRKFGINTLRHHKYLDGSGWQGFQSERSFVEFEPEGLDRFDYFNKCLKNNGIFVNLSPTFGVRFGRDDTARIPYWQELGTFNDKPDARIRTGFGMVYLAKEIQDLQIEQTVKLLNHKNPYTGLRYADDPFVFCVEMFNEDSVLFGGPNGCMQNSPTIRGRVAKQFSEWLLKKYGTDAAWQKAWGTEAIISDPANISRGHLKNLVNPKAVKGDFPAESLAAGTVLPWASPWFNDAALNPQSEQAFLRQRLLDSMVFLISLQDDFYERFMAAVRKTGYTGEFIASNWQAGSRAGHLLNLYSDSKTGMVDRHNYFGGAKGGAKPGVTFKNGSMLARPGMGNLSAGFQQVDNNAFMLSEWIHVQPNEWYAEGPVLMGAYGWGLQGWDVSYYFQMGGTGGLFSNRIGRNLWDGCNPVGLATFPVVARMVRRLDVTEAPETFTLNVHVPSLAEGKMSFLGTTVQNHDEKSFATDKVPMEALAATRVAVKFTDTYQDTPAFDIKPYLDGPTIVSATKQLRWTPSENDNPTGGYFTINTPGTKGFVGFAPGGKTFDLGDGFAITPGKGFAVILLAAKGETETLADAKEIILTAMARGRNTGMEFNPEGNQVLAMGKAPILLEPVKARLTIPFTGTLEILDHDGNAATSTRSAGESFEIDGTQEKTPFYLFRKK